MDRRTFITTATAAPLAAIGVGAAETVDPIVSSQRHYLAARHAFETTPEHLWGTGEENAYYEFSWDCSKQIYSNVPVTLEGLISQLEHYRQQFMERDAWGDDMDFQLIDNAIKGAKSLTT